MNRNDVLARFIELGQLVNSIDPGDSDACKQEIIQVCLDVKTMADGILQSIEATEG